MFFPFSSISINIQNDSNFNMSDHSFHPFIFFTKLVVITEFCNLVYPSAYLIHTSLHLHIFLALIHFIFRTQLVSFLNYITFEVNLNLYCTLSYLIKTKESELFEMLITCISTVCLIFY